MTDIELLKNAANAISLDYIECGRLDGSGDLIARQTGKIWNPLTDDGDALRLTVKLGLDICFGWDAPGGKITNVIIYGDDIVDVENGDPYEATRRAIVRAAAEIGK